MSRLAEVEIFIAVAEAGGFSAAARELGLTPSGVTRAIGRLEARLGARLFKRSTRKISLTAEGRVLLERGTRALDDLGAAEQAVSRMRQALRGRVRVNASVPIAHHRLVQMVTDFQRLHSEVEVDLTCSDTLVDVFDEGVDVAIRVGPLEDSGLRARALGVLRRRVVAAPEYVARFGRPETPADLVRHDCLRFSLFKGLNEWPFVEEGTARRVRVKGRVRANNGETMLALTLAGAGISRLADFMVEPQIEQGRLVPLLEAFNPRESQPIHAVFFESA